MTTYPLPDLGALVRELKRGAPGLAVGGVVAGARSLAVAALAVHGWPDRLALIVVPHVADAEDLAAGLGLLAPGIRAAVVPAELAGPYLGAEPPLAARLQAVQVMHRVASGDVDVVVVPARVLSSPMPLPNAISNAVYDIELGQRAVGPSFGGRIPPGRSRGGGGRVCDARMGG